MDSEVNVAEIDPKILALAQKLQAKKEEQLDKVKENAAKYGEWVDPTTVEFDSTANKYSVECTCVETGEKFRSFTSDLFQIKGLGPTARAERKTARKALRKAEVQAALALIRQQKS